MNLQGRNLTVGLTGPDVAELQSELIKLGFTVPAAEQQASSFGQGTVAAVRQFQTAQSIVVTGIVDPTTAAAVNDLLDSATYFVGGTVWSPNRAGVGALIVQLVDKNVGGDVVLASTTTDASGSYTVTAVLTPAALSARRKTSPDLQARVLSASSAAAGTVAVPTFVAASIVAYNASKVTTLDVILPPDATALASEYETLTVSLRSAYQGAFGALQENAQRQDVTYLANKTGWDARAVALAAIADQLSLGTVTTGTTGTTTPQATPTAPTQTPPAGASLPTTRPVLGPVTPAAPLAVNPAATAAVIKPEFYYALMRAGLPTNAEALYQTSPKTVQAVWQRAIAQGVIPQALSGEVTSALQTFQTLSAANALDAKPVIGVSTLRSMLNISLPDVNQQRQFALLQVQFQENHDGLWAATQKALGPQVTAQLQLDGKLGYLTLNNAPLITALRSAERASPVASALDLVSKGYYDPAKWQPLIGTSIPTEIAGASASEQSANYARMLASRVRLAFPTAVVADLIQKGKVPIQGDPKVATGVSSFLTANQGKFQIGVEPVDAYIARTKVTGTDSTVLSQIRRVQRVYQMTPDDQSLSALLQHNLDSAYAITRYDANGFIQSFGDALGGGQNAASIYSRAQQIYGSVLGVAMHYLTAQTGLQLGGSSQAPIVSPKSQPPSSPSYPVIAYPTLEELFGSLDYCACEDCRSILSPAAYLVDLLNFVDAPVVPPGYLNPQTVLLGRRPDIQFLPLTCANTNTALPYIDIVNETLEYFVSHNLSLAGFQGFSTADGITSDELLAIPQNIDDTAYGLLQKVYFPPPLPFQRPLGILRLHLEKIGVALADVMTALRAGDAIENGGAIVYGWRDILMEQLGLSRDEYQIFTNQAIGLRGLYGYGSKTEAAVLALLRNQSLQDFSRRTGVSYDDLFSIVQTRFINPNGALIAPLEQLNVPFSTLQKLHNGSITAAAFKASLPIGIDARAYGGASAADLDAIVTWVNTSYTQIMTIITYTDSSADPNLCSATSLLLRYTNPDPAASLLHGADFMRLIRFIRLWQKLGLSIDQTDDILTALYPAADLPTGASDAADYTRLDEGFLRLLPALGFLYQVMNLLGLSADSLASLLACWAPIDTTGDESLYATMFLTTPVQDAAFVIDAYGKVLQDASQTLGGHEATLCAAFNLSGAEFALILDACGLADASPLTLASISAIYRIGWLAHTLQLSVVEFLLLRQYSGLDPFQPLDPAPTPPVEPPVIRFIRLVQATSAANLQPVQALYLIWNQDVSGKSAPPDSDITSLAASLRANFAAVETQFTLVDDPSGAIANGLMAKVYGSAATDFFFGLLNGTLSTAADYSSATGDMPQPIIDASGGRLSYDDLRKQISFTGAIDSATTIAIDAAITANGNDPNLHAALNSLADANHQAIDPFFSTYPELLPLYAAYAASADSPQTRRTALLASFLPGLKQKRKQEQALAAITSAAGTDPSFANAMLQDPTILHAGANPTAAAVGDLTAIEAQGLSATFFLTNNPSLPSDQTVEAVANMNYGSAPGANALPPGQGGGAIAANWSGYVSAPQDGFYNVAIAADLGATVSFAIDGADVPLTASGNVFKNQSAIELTAGALVPIVLAVGNVRNTVSLSWESTGLGWQIVAGTYLYPRDAMDRLRSLYVRFLKATALADALALTADDIAYLDTYSSVHVETSDSVDALAPGVVTFRPSSIANIGVGSVLVVDQGAAQETVTVTAVNSGAIPATFSATTTAAHDGTAAPFAIVSQAAPSVGHGWFNFLPTSGSPDTTLSGRLRDVLTALLDYARIKAALSPGDGRLLAAIQDPAAVAADGTQPLLTLTGWALDSLQSLLTHFFGDADLSRLSSIENFRRVYDAYAMVTTCRVSADALIRATTNDPTPAEIGDLQSALRALYARPDWLTAVKPINDTMRQAQRDALVAWILQQFGDLPPSVPPAPTDLANINTPDKLYEYILIDAETEPPVLTSRIRLALSAVQLFIERCLRNLEPQASATNVDAARWQWMKRYRVWQANREVFLWPENWLYPELRDDQSPIFQQMMSDLLQSDITDDAAQTAYLNYLSSLEQVAKLEPCGIYYVPAVPNQSNEISYVIARTTGTGGKYYFRQFRNGSWTPWTQMPIDAEDLPVTPIIWNGRLFVFWLKTARQTPVSTSAMTKSTDKTQLAKVHISKLESAAQSSASKQTQVTVTAALCWSELYNNKWQPTRMSDLHRQTVIGTFAADDASFDAQRSLLQLMPAVLSGGEFDGALQLTVSSPIAGSKGGFVLHSTHVSPIRLEDVNSPVSAVALFLAALSSSRDFDPVLPYTGGSVAAVKGQTSPATVAITYRPGFFLTSPAQTRKILTTNLVPRYVTPQPGLADVWDAPFFFEDQRNTFYVTSSNAMVSVWEYNGYGIRGTLPELAGPNGKIPPLVFQAQQPRLPDKGDPSIFVTTPGGGDEYAMQAYVGIEQNIQRGLGSTMIVQYQGQSFGANGALTAPAQTTLLKGGQ